MSLGQGQAALLPSPRTNAQAFREVMLHAIAAMPDESIMQLQPIIGPFCLEQWLNSCPIPGVSDPVKPAAAEPTRKPVNVGDHTKGKQVHSLGLKVSASLRRRLMVALEPRGQWSEEGLMDLEFPTRSIESLMAGRDNYQMGPSIGAQIDKTLSNLGDNSDDE